MCATCEHGIARTDQVCEPRLPLQNVQPSQVTLFALLAHLPQVYSH